MNFAEGRVNPEIFKDFNRLKIQKAIGDVLSQLPTHDSQGFRSMGEPLQLIDEKVAIMYDVNQLGSEHGRCILGISVSLVDEELSYLAYSTYDVLEESDDMRTIKLGVETIKERESRGYGSGLLLASDDVMGYAINSYPQLNGKEVYANIQDAARSQRRDADVSPLTGRKGWSSNCEKLGYTQSESNSRTWRKRLE